MQILALLGIIQGLLLCLLLLFLSRNPVAPTLFMNHWTLKDPCSTDRREEEQTLHDLGLRNCGSAHTRRCQHPTR